MTAYRKPSKPERKPAGWPHEHVEAGPRVHPQKDEDEARLLRQAAWKSIITNVFVGVVVILLALGFIYGLFVHTLADERRRDDCRRRGGQVTGINEGRGWVCVPQVRHGP